MSELALYKRDNDFSNNVNGLPKGTMVFIYDVKKEPEITTSKLGQAIIEVQDEITSTDISNIFYIKKELGMFKVEEDLWNTICWKYSGGKIKNKEDPDALADKVLNDFVYKKYYEICKCHYKICHFFLRNLHDLVWKDYDNGILSILNLRDCIDLLKPATEAFYNILITQVLLKYPDDLSTTSIKQSLEKKTLDLKHKGLLNMKHPKKQK